VRVLVLTNMYPPHHYGGYEVNCQAVVHAFRAAGHEVLVLTSDHEVPGVDAGTEDRALVRRDLRLYWDDHLIRKPPLRECLAIERHNQRVLLDAIESHRPDVVSAWHMGAMSFGLLTASRRRGLPIVAMVEDDWLVYGPRVDRWTRVWRWLGPLGAVGDRIFGVPCRRQDVGKQATYCFISKSTLRTVQQKTRWSFPDRTITYIGINVDDFPAGRYPPRPSWNWRLLYLGRIDDRKGIDTAIRALTLLPDEATLAVVGRGDDRYLEEMHALTRSLGVEERVSFSFVDRDRVADAYAGADVLLFPPRWAEPFGLVPLEAMACATPTVATATGGSAEFLVDGVNCLRIPIDDHEAMAAAVRRLADDPALRARIVAAGLVTAGELTVPRQAELLERWHLAAIDRFAHGRPPDREPIEDVLDRSLR
jgi:glycosyltransferase involved in cell wall biosynthesis